MLQKKPMDTVEKLIKAIQDNPLGHSKEDLNDVHRSLDDDESNVKKRRKRFTRKKMDLPMTSPSNSHLKSMNLEARRKFMMKGTVLDRDSAEQQVNRPPTDQKNFDSFVLSMDMYRKAMRARVEDVIQTERAKTRDLGKSCNMDRHVDKVEASDNLKRSDLQKDNARSIEVLQKRSLSRLRSKGSKESFNETRNNNSERNGQASPPPRKFDSNRVRAIISNKRRQSPKITATDEDRIQYRSRNDKSDFLGEHGKEMAFVKSDTEENDLNESDGNHIRSSRTVYSRKDSKRRPKELAFLQRPTIKPRQLRKSLSSRKNMQSTDTKIRKVKPIYDWERMGSSKRETQSRNSPTEFQHEFRQTRSKRRQQPGQQQLLDQMQNQQEFEFQITMSPQDFEKLQVQMGLLDVARQLLHEESISTTRRSRSLDPDLRGSRNHCSLSRASSPKRNFLRRGEGTLSSTAPKTSILQHSQHRDLLFSLTRGPWSPPKYEPRPSSPRERWVTDKDFRTFGSREIGRRESELQSSSPFSSKRFSFREKTDTPFISSVPFRVPLRTTTAVSCIDKLHRIGDL